MAGIPWTNKEREILIKLAEMGLPAKDVGLVLKSRSICSISNQAKVMGLSLCVKDVEIDEAAFKRLMNRKGK